MNEKQMIKADFFVSLLLVAFSLFIVIAGVLMPRYENWGYYAMPAMSPLFFGIVLLFMSLVLLYRSVVRKGYRIRLNRDHWNRFRESAAVRRFGVCLGLVIAYYLLLGTVDFVLLTAAFLFGNIAYFKGAKWWSNLIVSFVTSLSVWLVFYKIFMGPLP